MAVLDGKRIVVFSKSGEKQELAPQGFNTTSDLCADHEGALVTINRYVCSGLASLVPFNGWSYIIS